MRVHLNGAIVESDAALVSVFDRGFLFGDGIYEGLRAFDGWVRNLDDHVARMGRGLAEAGIAWDPARLGGLCTALLEANGLRDAFLYWQVTRGTPGPGQPVRARLPSPGMDPTVFGYCLPLPGVDGLVEPTTCTAVTVADERWHKGHVKTVSLMANIMAAMRASETGGEEAILVREGEVSESCATNVFVVVEGAGGVEIATPPVESVSILAGVTRKLLLEIRPDIRVRTVAASELERALEVFIVGTMTTVKSVVRLDGREVGGGEPGPVARGVLDDYAAYIRSRIGAGV